jgi:ankyrin repeat protein
MAKTLHGAIKQGDLAAVQALLAAGAEVNPKDKYMSPLREAVYNAAPAFVIALAQVGAHVRVRFVDRSTLLHPPPLCDRCTRGN